MAGLAAHVCMRRGEGRRVGKNRIARLISHHGIQGRHKHRAPRATDSKLLGAGALNWRPRRLGSIERHASDQDKARLVAEAARLTKACMARRHGVCSSLLYRWRREGVGAPWPAASAQGLIPLQIAEEYREAPAPQQAETVRVERLVEITLPNGCSVRVDQHVDGKALRRILAALCR